MGPPSCMRSVVDRNAVMRRMTLVSVLSVTDSLHAMTSDRGGRREGDLQPSLERTLRGSIVLVFILLICDRTAKCQGQGNRRLLGNRRPADSVRRARKRLRDWHPWRQDKPGMACNTLHGLVMTTVERTGLHHKLGYDRITSQVRMWQDYIAS
jgi:hypothetical protein